jgi:hypothetical protein
MCKIKLDTQTIFILPSISLSGIFRSCDSPVPRRIYRFLTFPVTALNVPNAPPALLYSFHCWTGISQMDHCQSDANHFILQISNKILILCFSALFAQLHRFDASNVRDRCRETIVNRVFVISKSPFATTLTLIIRFNTQKDTQIMLNSNISIHPIMKPIIWIL